MKQPLPMLLEVFPDSRDQIISFAVNNLAKLLIECVHNFIISKVIPRRLITPWKSDSTNEDLLNHDDRKRSFLYAHQLE